MNIKFVLCDISHTIYRKKLLYTNPMKTAIHLHNDNYNKQDILLCNCTHGVCTGKKNKLTY